MCLQGYFAYFHESLIQIQLGCKLVGWSRAFSPLQYETIAISYPMTMWRSMSPEAPYKHQVLFCIYMSCILKWQAGNCWEKLVFTIAVWKYEAIKKQNHSTPFREDFWGLWWHSFVVKKTVGWNLWRFLMRKNACADLSRSILRSNALHYTLLRSRFRSGGDCIGNRTTIGFSPVASNLPRQAEMSNTTSV